MTFLPGITPIPVSGKVTDDAEIEAGCRAVRAGRWTSGGVETPAFERELAQFVGVRDALFVNSGSSANLCAVAAIAAPENGERQLRPGDEVIVCAGGAFPTTISPLLFFGAVPVFVDAAPPTYQPDSQLSDALSSRTRAVMFAHTLGNPFHTEHVAKFCHHHGLWFIEDCCDAIGSELNGKKCGTFGHLATTSHYPAHLFTTGEGGCVLSNDPKLMLFARRFSEWGRRCICRPGVSNTCGKRFGWSLDTMTPGYDDKYLYSVPGLNLKNNDIAAAIGRVQLTKVPEFITARERNFAALHEGLKPLEEWFILPESLPGAKPVWFGYPLTVRSNTRFHRTELMQHLESKGIDSRPLFAGNLTRQPMMRGVQYRQIGDLRGADQIMRDCLWIGCWPGLGSEQINYVVETVKEFCHV